jgi:hypothetical protein
MGKHTAVPGLSRRLLSVVGVLAATALAVAGALAMVDDPPAEPADTRGACDRMLRVVTATSFAPVLTALAPALDADDDCVRLDVTAVDGRAAVAEVTGREADLWIPDDGAWAGTAGSLQLAEAPAGGAGTVLATSPIYMVTDRPTANRLQQAGGSWLGLARAVDGNAVRLVVRDPNGSGDGMVAAGAVAEAVWLDSDMDASALWLARAQNRTRIVTDARPALPESPGEVGLVPEHALLSVPGGTGKAAMPGSDHSATLRYTWLPMADAATSPTRAGALDRLREELTGPSAAAYLRVANLRTPDGRRAPGGGTGPLPEPKAKPLETLKPHHVDHVFATWYQADRRTDLLVAVDVSGSMAEPAAGSTASRMSLVKQGLRSLGTLLPDESRMGLWEFGSEIDGKRDYRQLVGMAALDPGHRRALGSATGGLAARPTGTGLYDTILAAYTSARNAYRDGVPNQVLIFTDGRNEDDAKSLSAAQLAARLKAAVDPKRPVMLSVVTFGTPADAVVMEKALEPVEGYVDTLQTADEVAAVFIHVAAGGLHH